ncbi:MAG: AAA family ATPase [Treponema sp.]|jgi:putative ATPase|nr:AAA family ATPase [Treponema sp.]
MDDLFSAGSGAGNNERQGEGQSPLADRMRPRILEDVIGQDHIVGPGRLLRRAIQADRLSSVIFYGPPGTGKTSLARVIANTTRAAFESLNAVLSGVKNIREAIDRADERFRLYSKRTILFVDEVHRWNKAQQDALLPWVENGTVILVGATTENPFFEVNRALVSRSRIFQLKPLGADDLAETARRAVTDAERGYGKWKVTFEDGALEHLVEVSGGDARSLLNALELAVETSDWNFPDKVQTKINEPHSRSFPERETPIRTGEAGSHWPPPEGASIHISLEAAEESIQQRAVLYDRDGDYHFDTISAFIKSVRGSDPDAALYWLAKMVRAGEDPSFIFRRMIILASEDVGLADPHALAVVISCAEAFDRIGFPEGNFPLAHACLYLATAPKSNTALTFFDALKEVDREDAEVPNHLRDSSRDAEGFGHGEGYIYPHAYRNHWAAQQYLPTALRGRTFYLPSTVGYEGKIREEVLQKRELQAAVVLSDGPSAGDGELLSWSAAAKGREGWFKRLESGRSALLLSDRDALFNAASPSRHSRVLIPLAGDGLLLWESLRRCPEGLSAALVGSAAAREALLRYASALDITEQPEIAVLEDGPLPSPQQAAEWFSSPIFDHILLREPWRKGFAAGTQTAEAAFSRLAISAQPLLAPGGCLALLCSPPLLGQRISRLLLDECDNSQLAEKLGQAEDAFFSQTDSWNWDADAVSNAFEAQGLKLKIQTLDQKEERLIGPKDIDVWFDREKSRWGVFMGKALNADDFAQIEAMLRQRIQAGPLPWNWKSLLLRAE